MSRPIAVLPLLLLAMASPAAAADQPAKISAAEVDGVFSGPKAVIRERNGHSTKWVEMLKSTDKTMSAGIYEASASRTEFPSYANDEFMYFLKGSVTLTSADGTVTKIAAGDAVTIPRGWKGVWETPGYVKYYVTYKPAK